MADTIKCPNCGGNLLFDADLQKLACEFCGGAFLPSEIKSEVEELVSDDNATDEAIIEDDSVSETVMETVPDANPDESNYNADDYVEYVCNACGAAVVAEKTQSATFCAFCGSPALVGQKLSREFRPKYIIPFKYGKKNAVDKFLAWCKGGRMSPFGFASDKNIEKLTGLYVPYWLFSVDAKMARQSKATTSTSTRVGDTITTVTKHFTLVRNAKYTWKNIPLDGATKIDDALMESIEPFDFKAMVPYDYKYIPGFYADVYDLTDEDLKRRASARCRQYLDDEYNASIKSYATKRLVIKNDTLDDISAEYALLPVWFMSYKYLGKTYNFAMNGQTGEVAGVPPVSVMKRVMLFFVFMAVFSVITKIIVGLILGGFVG